eukprot:GFYU01004515.1.p1 GENE.GFYU01004515.1~~GFYU01004515.1.p1  ORF type:complete len:736 (-),score=144.22 GFYU01004515.1:81-2288(-)
MGGAPSKVADEIRDTFEDAVDDFNRAIAEQNVGQGTEVLASSASGDYVQGYNNGTGKYTNYSLPAWKASADDTAALLARMHETMNEEDGEVQEELDKEQAMEHRDNLRPRNLFGKFFTWFEPTDHYGAHGTALELFFRIITRLLGLWFFFIPFAIAMMAVNDIEGNNGEVKHTGGFIVSTSTGAFKFGDIPEWQPIIDMIFFIFIPAFALIYLDIHMEIVARNNDRDAITPADFAVHVYFGNKEVVENMAEKQKELGEWFEEKFGPVVYVSLGMRVGEMEELVARRHDLLEDLHEAQVCAKSTETPSEKQLAKIQKIKGKIKVVEEKMDHPDLAVSHEWTGHAFVTFKQSVDADKCFKKLNPGVWRRLINLICPCCFEKPSFHGVTLIANRAVEPDNVIWKNLRFTQKEARLQSLRIAGATFGLVALSAGVLVALAVGKQSLNESADNTKFDPNDPTSVAIRALSVLTSLSVTAINSALVIVINKMTKFERRHFEEDLEGSLLLRLALAQIVNTVLIVFLVYIDDEDKWYEPGGMAQQIFYICLTNAFLPDIATLLNPKLIIGRCKGRSARTQTYLNRLYEPPPLHLGEWYANLLKTVSIPMFYGAMVPATHLITFFALLSTGFACRVSFASILRKPVPMRQGPTRKVRKVFWLLLFFHYLISATVYKWDPYWITVPIILAIIYILPFNVVGRWLAGNLLFTLEDATWKPELQKYICPWGDTENIAHSIAGVDGQ